MNRIVVSASVLIGCFLFMVQQPLAGQEPATPLPLASPEEANVPTQGGGNLRLVPKEVATVSRYSNGNILRWSAQFIFAPTEAARTKVLYAYDPEACRSEWANALKRPQKMTSISFMRHDQIQAVDSGKSDWLPINLWTLESSQGSTDSGTFNADGEWLCDAARRNGYWIVSDRAFAGPEYRSRLVAKTVMETEESSQDQRTGE